MAHALVMRGSCFGDQWPMHHCYFEYWFSLFIICRSVPLGVCNCRYQSSIMYIAEFLLLNPTWPKYLRASARELYWLMCLHIDDLMQNGITLLLTHWSYVSLHEDFKYLLTWKALGGMISSKWVGRLYWLIYVYICVKIRGHWEGWLVLSG